MPYYPTFVRQMQGGATRSQDIGQALEQQLAYAAMNTGVTVEVFSGGQPASGPDRVGSDRHNHGNAADIKLRDVETGRLLDMRNTADQARMQEFVQHSVAAGATGVGAGTGYMGPNSLHIGGGSSVSWGEGGRSKNAPDWIRQAWADGSAAKIPAKELSNVMKPYSSVGEYASAVKSAAKGVGDAFSGAAGAGSSFLGGLNLGNAKLELGPGFGLLGKIGNAFLRAGDEPTRNSDGQRITRSDVRALQGQLNAAGSSPGFSQNLGTNTGRNTLATDGRFGELSAGAVKDFQSNIGIAPDGVFGPITADALARYNAAFNGKQLAPTEGNINPYGVQGNPADLQTMASVPNAALVTSKTDAPPAWSTAGPLDAPTGGTLGTVAALIAAQAARAKGGPGNEPGAGGDGSDGSGAAEGNASGSTGGYKWSGAPIYGGGGGGGGGLPLRIQQNATRSSAGGVAPGARVPNTGAATRFVPPYVPQGTGLPSEGLLGMMAGTVNPGYDPDLWGKVDRGEVPVQAWREGMTDDEQPPWWGGGEELPWNGGVPQGDAPGMADAPWDQPYNPNKWDEVGGPAWDSPMMTDMVSAPWQQLHAGDVVWPDNPYPGGYASNSLGDLYNPMGSYTGPGYDGSADWSTPWVSTPMADWSSFDIPFTQYGGYESNLPILPMMSQSPTTSYDNFGNSAGINWANMEQNMGLPPQTDWTATQWNGGYNGPVPGVGAPETYNPYGNQVAPGINPNVFDQVLLNDINNSQNWLANTAPIWGVSGLY